LRQKTAKRLRKLAHLIWLTATEYNAFLTERQIYQKLKRDYKEAKRNGYA
jgi:hypothetical protein